MSRNDSPVRESSWWTTASGACTWPMTCSTGVKHSSSSTPSPAAEHPAPFTSSRPTMKVHRHSRSRRTRNGSRCGVREPERARPQGVAAALLGSRRPLPRRSLRRKKARVRGRAVRGRAMKWLLSIAVRSRVGRRLQHEPARAGRRRRRRPSHSSCATTASRRSTWSRIAVEPDDHGRSRSRRTSSNERGRAVATAASRACPVCGPCWVGPR